MPTKSRKKKRKALVFTILVIVYPLALRDGFKGNSQRTKQMTSRNMRFEKDTKFLIYFSHSGFSNQIIGLQRASYFASLTNRTLILPPLLPHEGDVPDTFPTWTPRKAGHGCQPFINQSSHVELVMHDANEITSGKQFSSLTELIDFEEVSSQLKVKYIDLSALSMDELTPGWISYNTSNHRCSIESSYQWQSVVDAFNAHFGPEKIVCIGSAYWLLNPKKATLPSYHEHQYLMPGFFMSKKLQNLVAHVRRTLPEFYFGIHIRFADDAILNCSEKKIISVYHDIIDKAKFQNGAFVLVGKSNPKVKECFDWHSASMNIRSATLDEVMKGNSIIDALVETFRIDRNTLMLNLDQIILSLADEIFFAGKAGKWASTFQVLIKKMHRNRKKIISTLQPTELANSYMDLT